MPCCRKEKKNSTPVGVFGWPRIDCGVSFLLPMMLPCCMLMILLCMCILHFASCLPRLAIQSTTTPIVEMYTVRQGQNYIVEMLAQYHMCWCMCLRVAVHDCWQVKRCTHTAASRFLTLSCCRRLLNEGQVPFVETVPFRVIAVFTALQFIGLAAVYVVSSWTGVSTGATKKPTLAHC